MPSTGSWAAPARLMVHGGCSSIGCYAMTDASIDEIYAVVEAALDRGQEGSTSRSSRSG